MLDCRQIGEKRHESSCCCPLCDQHPESINHLLVSYVFTRVFWYTMVRRSGLHSLAPQPDATSFLDWWEISSDKLFLGWLRRAWIPSSYWEPGWFGSTGIGWCLMEPLQTSPFCSDLLRRKDTNGNWPVPKGSPSWWRQCQMFRGGAERCRWLLVNRWIVSCTLVSGLSNGKVFL